MRSVHCAVIFIPLHADPLAHDASPQLGRRPWRCRGSRAPSAPSGGRGGLFSLAVLWVVFKSKSLTHDFCMQWRRGGRGGTAGGGRRELGTVADHPGRPSGLLGGRGLPPKDRVPGSRLALADSKAQPDRAGNAQLYLMATQKLGTP